MNTTKDEVQSLLRKLPDDCTFEDVQYHLYVIEKIRKGIERAESEGTVSLEKVERRLARWTSKMWEYRQQILSTDVLTRECRCNYGPWEHRFREKSEICRHIQIVREAFPDIMTRQNIIQFFQRGGRDADVTKFLATMIWGYGPDEGGRSDNRGPARVEQMTSKLDHLRDVLRDTACQIEKGALEEAYRGFDIAWCGPSFRSKYFYFVGKSLGIKGYPLIFDNRVAVGLARVGGLRNDLLGMVSIQTKGTASAYTRYTNLLHELASQMACEADQIELFLFDLAGNVSKS